MNVNLKVDTERLITKALDYRAHGKYSKSLIVLESVVGKSLRSNIQYFMGCIQLNLLDKALETYLLIDKKDIPYYVADCLFVKLFLAKKNKNVLLGLFSGTTSEVYLSELLVVQDIECNFRRFVESINIYSGLTKDIQARLLPCINRITEELFLNSLYDIEVDRSKKLELLEYAISKGKEKHTIEDCLLYMIYQVKNINLPVDNINPHLLYNVDNLYNITVFCYSNAEIDKIIIFLQAFIPKLPVEVIVKQLMLDLIFPCIVNKDNQLSTVRGGNFYYRYFHYIAAILGSKSQLLISRDLLCNESWHAGNFVAGSYEYFKGNFSLTKYYYQKTIDEIESLDLSKQLIGSMGHIISALCWDPSVVMANKLDNISEDKSLLGISNEAEIPSGIEQELCFVLGADVGYSNDFAAIFFEIHKKINSETVKLSAFYLNVTSNKEYFNTNNNCLNLWHDRYLKGQFFYTNLILENTIDSSDIQQFKGVYTLLRYLNLREMMENNPNVKNFIVSDIDCYPQIPDKTIIEIISSYDIVISAIKNVKDFGVPSYIGAGCLAVSNNKLGMIFVDKMIKTIYSSYNNESINRWNLDQAAIRTALTDMDELKIGYFPVIGNVMKFANAYKSKAIYKLKVTEEFEIDACYPLLS